MLGWRWLVLRDTFETFSSYAVPLGQAFQIQDDIISTFGSEEKIGKPVDSDIKEGKRTLLVVKAYEFSNRTEKKLLDSVIGNKKARKKDIEAVREIMRDSGSLKYSQELAFRLIKRAKEALYGEKLEEDGKKYLLQAADYLLNRSS